MEAFTKPKCELIGRDGNVFFIIGSVSRVLKSAGYPDKAKEFVERAKNSKSYDEVLGLLDEYVEVG